MEETIKMKTYEAMFLLEAGQGNFETACEPIRTVLDRAGAEVLRLDLWDERRLAYEIKGHKRGMYVLTYFRLDPAKVAELEHDCQLNEGILRVLIIRKDNLRDEELRAPTPAMTAVAEREAAPKAGEAQPAQQQEEQDPAVKAVEAIEAAEADETPEPVTE